MRHRAPRPVLDRLRILSRTRGVLATATLVLGGVVAGAVLSAGDPADDAAVAGPAMPLPPAPGTSTRAREHTPGPAAPASRSSDGVRHVPAEAAETSLLSPSGPSRAQAREEHDERRGGGHGKGRTKADSRTHDERRAPGSQRRSEASGTKQHGKK